MTPRAMILAAGRGERLRPLTDRTPKPLLRVGGLCLIEWHLHALAAGGVVEVVVNTAWLEERFVPALGDGSRYGVRIHWSHERADHGGALETAGGIRKALPLLGDAFWVVSADVFVPDFRFDPAEWSRFIRSGSLAHLWMVPNPAHHPAGDFSHSPEGRLADGAGRRLTWGSIGLFRSELFAALSPGQPARLRPLLDAAARGDRLTGTVMSGRWIDVGTPERLALARGWLLPDGTRR